MRVHGDKVIRRRSGLEKRADYKAYLTELREDFQHMCGYCGKTEAITKNKFEIDHFVPKKYAEDRVNDYMPVGYVIAKRRQNGHRRIRIFPLWTEKVL